MTFKPSLSRREMQKAVVGFIGPSGSGKTLSALRVAFGMMSEKYKDKDSEFIWSKIGVIDTEHKRSMLYTGQSFGELEIKSFYHIDLEPPYSTERYIQALKALKDAGAEVIIVDSLSHNWSGKGGIVDEQSRMPGNSFQNWGKMAPHTHELVDALTKNDVHILTTMRVKTEYVVEPNENGKMAPRKVGTKPVQKDEFEYEFMINFSIDMDNVASVSKDNSHLFHTPRVLTEEDGVDLYKWLELGVDVVKEKEEERLRLLGLVKELGEVSEEAEQLIGSFESSAGMTIDNFNLKFIQGAYERLQEKLNVARSKEITVESDVN